MFPIVKLIITWLVCIQFIHSFQKTGECHATEDHHTESEHSETYLPDNSNYEDLDILPKKKTTVIKTTSIIFQLPTSINNALYLLEPEEPGQVQNEDTSTSSLVAMSVSISIVAILIIIISIAILVNLD